VRSPTPLHWGCKQCHALPGVSDIGAPPSCPVVTPANGGARFAGATLALQARFFYSNLVSRTR